jgi:ABC-type transport system involved in multi-copper enzyme maturation permease subunit
MNRSIVWQLILKDLYLVRWMVAGSIAAGAVAVAVMPVSTVWGYVGGVSLICVLIILNIFLVMGGVVQEKKDKVQLFMLSLPVSTTQYTAAKVLANAIAFVAPWLVLTVGAIAMIDASSIPNGMLPFWLTVHIYLLLYFCVLLAIALVSDSTGLHATVITLGNVSLNFLIPLLLGLPSVSGHREGPAAVWTADIVSIIAIELAAGVAAVIIAFYVRSRTADFV